MRLRIFRKLATTYTAVFLFLLCLILILDYLGFMVRADNSIYDLFSRLKGSRQTDNRIVIAAIDEKTLKEFGSWPLSRDYYALLLERTHEASAVGIDILFTESSPEDTRLSAAIRRHGKVILPVYLNRQMEFVYPLPCLTPLKTGHLHAEPGVDGIVREIFHTIDNGDKRIPSFSSAIYETIAGNRFGSGGLLPSSKQQHEKPYRMDGMLINFYGPPATFPHISLADVIAGKFEDSCFFDKIVLVGYIVPGVVDNFMTPLSQNRDMMPGIEVHANAINNLLDGSNIRKSSDRFRYPLAILFSIILFASFIRTDEKKSVIFWTCCITLIFIVSFILLAHVHFWIEPVLLLLSASLSFATTYVYRLDEAARLLDIKYSSIISLPEMGGLQTPKETAGKGVFTFLSAEGIDSRIRKLLSVEDEYAIKLHNIIEKKTVELSDALKMVKTMSNEMIVRLLSAAESKDSYTSGHLSRIRLYAKKLSESLGMDGDFIENITFASAMHDIGKIGIPDRILMKPGELTPEEFEIMKTHVHIGEKILSDSVHPIIQMSATIALHHHEKWNGAGYPRELKGTDIPIEARIVMLCDIYEALRNARPYKKALSHMEAFLKIVEGDSRTSPDYFDPDILKMFIRINGVFEEIFTKFTDSQKEI